MNINTGTFVIDSLIQENDYLENDRHKPHNDFLADDLYEDDGKKVIRTRTGQGYADKGGHGERHKLAQQERDEQRDKRKIARGC